MKRRGDEGGRRRRRRRDEEDDSDGEGEKEQPLTFEDPFVDEYESESDDPEELPEEEADQVEFDPSEAIDAPEAGDGEGAGAGAGSGSGPAPKVWRPGVDEVGDDEELQFASDAYVMYHQMRGEWPCLSFDVLPDKLGMGRTSFPMTAYIVAGTQADKPSNNKVTVMKFSEMHRTQDDDDSEADNSDVEDDPVLENASVPHRGGVNRIRAMPQAPNMVATWADTGKVHLFNIANQLARLDRGRFVPGASSAAPVFTFKGHPAEGFAMDWSPVMPGRLATGDCSHNIYLWDAVEGKAEALADSSVGTWNVNKVPYKGHKDSVEDLQWSPNEAHVFSSASVDKTVRIWDARNFTASMLDVEAHDTDVNVLSWNKQMPFLLASGGDDGSFKVWDLRKFDASKPLAFFRWHSGPVTSIEWSPHDMNELVVSSADNIVSLWDMSVEDDTDAASAAPEDVAALPQQLMFIHQGQTDVKEAHYHPQVPGMVITTALDGFNVFKPDIKLVGEEGEEVDPSTGASAGGGAGAGAAPDA